MCYNVAQLRQDGLTLTSLRIYYASTYKVQNIQSKAALPENYLYFKESV